MFKNYIRVLILIAGMCGIASYHACQEGDAHNQSGLCMINIDLPPPALGFEYWTQVGIALAIVGSGLAVAAGMLVGRDD